LIDRFRSLVAELRRRNVFKVASVYAVTAWGASMGASSLFPAFGAPAWAVPLFVAVAVLGLPIAVALAWAYELGPGRSLARDRGSERDGQGQSVALPPAAEDGTQLLAQASSVRVHWEDSRGQHDRCFARNFRIGRDGSCDVNLDDPLTSRRHAAVDYQDGLWWVIDLQSRNGTLLNGKRVSRAPLPSRCEIKVHEHAAPIRLEIVSSPDARTVTSSRIHLTNE
jgi:hypothetical protein